MDKGAHFFRCDLQVHTPRDLRWVGPVPTAAEDRLEYAKRFVQACRLKGMDAVAITDHHCMTFLPYIRQAAAEERAPDGSEMEENRRLVVFPGMELTLGVPCQAIVLFDADFPNDMFSLAMAALAINQNGDDEAKTKQVERLGGITTFSLLKNRLDEHEYLRGRYIVFPNVTDEGQHSLLRNGQADKYTEMPCVGGYCDGGYQNLRVGTRNKLEGKEAAWGNKRIACLQTSDARRDDHTTLGEPSTWLKWATPTAEALRQACLAQESRVAHEPPKIPDTYISSVSVGNSQFLGPVDFELNPQYSSLIGGRGTGKSTVLEYIRWALCDQPPSGDEDETPNYQSRRARLIQGTLTPLGATVDVTYVLNGVPHLVRRSSVDGTVKMKVGSGELAPCTEDEVRSILPIQAYSQKQLSDVSVRIDELTRFITTPIKKDLNLTSRLAVEHANRARETYASLQRYRDLERTLGNRELEAKSVSEQANNLRESLDGVSEEDRKILDQGPTYRAAKSVVSSWRAGAGTVNEKITEAIKLVVEQRQSIQASPDEPVEHKLTLDAAHQDFGDVLSQALASLEALGAETSRIQTAQDEGSSWADWDSANATFEQEYASALQRSSAHTEKLEQLRNLEARLVELSEETSRIREALKTLSEAAANYSGARDKWLEALDRYDDLVDSECSKLTERSSGLIRVGVKRFADPSQFVDGLRQALQGSRIQTSKFEKIGESISSADNPQELWNFIVDELEALAAYDEERSSTEARPNAPKLITIGLNAGDLDRIARTMTPENWLVLSLIPIASEPVYDFKAREGQYIPFENASAGQQATALLKTLLNQPGPPLIIDQPEEDLDNPVILEIVTQLWEAKQLRQIIFASHNANLVVNGDAELVAWFGHRTTGDQSRGTVQGVGAIDIPEARDAIKAIMEGGENAFRLRFEKYGF